MDHVDKAYLQSHFDEEEQNIEEQMIKGDIKQAAEPASSQN